MEQKSPIQIADQWPASALAEAISVLRRVHGLDAAIYDEVFLAKSLEKRRTARACDTISAYLNCLAHDRVEAEQLFRSLNINYSAFFRNPLTFALLERAVLPALVNAREKTGQSAIRIWSAACAAGQEAWSVAILLEDLAVARERQVLYEIIATDVSDDALTLARRGIYDLTEVQNTPLKHIHTHFSVHKESYAILPALKAHVDFSLYDLLDESSSSPAAGIYGDFDLVFCSNLLFYYRPEIRNRILDKVCRALSPGGYFVTGEAERDIVAKQKNLRATMPFAAVFQKI